MRKKMRRTYPRKQGMEYIHGGNKMLKLSLKQGQYVNIGGIMWQVWLVVMRR